MKRLQPFPHGHNVRCILFDLGYTLWDRRKNPILWNHAEAASNRKAISVLCKYVSPVVLPTGSNDVIGKQLRERFDEHEHEMIRRDPVHEPDGPLAVMLTLKDWDIEHVDEAVGKEVFEALNVRIPASLPLMDDALSTLAALRERGFLLGVVTNRMWGGEEFHTDLRALGLLNYFDERAIAVSADVGVRKPSPLLFQAALDAFQVTPRETLMVGDALRTDILGAQRLGLYTAWLPRTKQRERVNAYLADPQCPFVPFSAKPRLQELTPQEASTDTSFYDEDYMPANMPGRDGYLERFLLGEIRPDLIIETVSDLLDVFLIEEKVG